MQTPGVAARLERRPSWDARRRPSFANRVALSWTGSHSLGLGRLRLPGLLFLQREGSTFPTSPAFSVSRVSPVTCLQIVYIKKLSTQILETEPSPPVRTPLLAGRAGREDLFQLSTFGSSVILQLRGSHGNLFHCLGDSDLMTSPTGETNLEANGHFSWVPRRLQVGVPALEGAQAGVARERPSVS